jgi:hypothetical protein
MDCIEGLDFLFLCGNSEILSKTGPSTHRPTAFFPFEFGLLNSSKIAVAINSVQLAAITIDSKQGARWRLTKSN